MSTLENLISDTGGCGRFQVIQVMAINSLRLVSVWGLVFMTFGNYNPGWRCEDNHANITTLMQSAVNLQGNSSGNREFAKERRVENFAFPGSAAVNEDIALKHVKQNHSSDTNMSYGFNVSATIEDVWPARATEDDNYLLKCKGYSSCRTIDFDPGSRTVVTQWGLACESAWIVPFMISIQMVGLLVGCTSAGQISELFGRRKALYGSGAIYSLANFVAIFTVSWQMHTVCLFVIGVGAGGVLTVAVVYFFEFLEPRWRGIVGGLPLMDLSIALFAFIIFLERDWQYLHITIAVISALCVVPVLWVPESMRWLAVRGRVSEARAVVCKIASVNKSPMPDNNDMKALQSLADDQQTAVTNRRYNYWDLIREKSLRGMTIKLTLIWICEVTVYYSLSFSVKVFSGNFYTNLLIYTVVDIPVVVFVGPLANRWGRKRCGFIFFFVASLACLAVVVINVTKPENNAQALATIVLASAAKSTVSGGRTVKNIITGELPPTVVRNLCYAFCMLTSRIGTVISPYLIPEPDTVHISFSIMAALLFLTSSTFLTLPETKDRPMADTVISISKTAMTSAREDGTEDIGEGLHHKG